MRYREFCAGADLPLQFQPWWLDAVCAAGRWDVSLATDAGERITGVLPYFLTRRYGLPAVLLPPFTSYAGPWYFYPPNPDFKEVSRLAFEKAVGAELIRQLPATVFFRQNLRPEITNWLPFYWAGYRQTTRYTYVLEPSPDPVAALAGFKNSLRTDLKKARAATSISAEDDPELLIQLYRQSLLRQRIRPARDLRPTLLRLYAALHQRQQGQILVARDRQTQSPHAALLLAHDGRQAALLATGADPRHRPSAAGLGLLTAALEFCGERTLRLDFEGSMRENMERVFRAFGGRLTPYSQVWKWF